MTGPLRNALVLLALAAAPLALGAQGSTRRPAPPPTIPAHMIPPAGKCRIWMANVAPAQQPAPTDCQTALRQKPSDGTVIFGPSPRSSDSTAFDSKPAPRPDSAARDITLRPDSAARDTTPRAPATPRGRPQRPQPRAPERP